MTNEERPIMQSDYERIYALLHAYDLKLTGSEEEPLWQILRRLHEEHLPSQPVPLDDLIAERGPVSLPAGPVSLRSRRRAPRASRACW